ncbi:TetR/AcrR family transcriptional regulator [Kordiimonas aquimaris]|uniref:TetR/AcrR family transcriptional regulator n=1 Tax=Kordiimonas aquimaris TaxID=707591 RepID=UPI0021D1BC87|nr:TetR/AcrR family transcriptional regulator [Kordiimonas aquimaris]
MANIDLKKRAEIGEKRRARTLDLLIDSAMECFAENTVSTITTDDICKSAGVSRGTFYNYFNDMDDLIISVLERFRDSIETKLVGQAKGVQAGPERMAIVFAWVCQLTKTDPVMAKIFLFAAGTEHPGKFEDIFKSKLLEDIHACRSHGLITLNNDTIALDFANGTLDRVLRSLLEEKITLPQASIYLECLFTAMGMPAGRATDFAALSRSSYETAQDK